MQSIGQLKTEGEMYLQTNQTTTRPPDAQPLLGRTFIDLFAGLGGFRLALESLGAKSVYSSEINPEVRAVYADNFGEMPDGDITKVDAASIPDHDILCAGFPCQPFSITGRKRGFQDSRGTLFFDIARIIEAKLPSVVFLENVSNFAVHDRGKTLRVVQDTIQRLGYSFSYQVINAAKHGVPQQRKRVYMVCFREDAHYISFQFPQPVPLTKHVQDVLLDDESLVEHLYRDRELILPSKPINDVPSDKPIRCCSVNLGRQGERIYSIKGTAITLCATGGGLFGKTGGYLINGRPRGLHPRECARLMGFPDCYRLDSNSRQAYRQLGNSVAVPVIRAIGEQIGLALNATKGGQTHYAACY
jgi:DNA (cytosine-5)-methyltransferase 1